MAKLSIGEKAERVLRFFLGLRDRRVVAKLAKHGFTRDEINEGWRLLQAVTGTKLDVFAEAERDPAALAALDEWENQWFPIAQATLTRRYPDIQEWMFRNLTQTEGPAVIVSVTTFVQRLELMPKSKKDGGCGPTGAAARKVLESRGIDAAAVEEANALLERLKTTASPEEALQAHEAEEDDSAAYAQAETDLWAWYLEWSTIARRAIKSRGLLRKLGFLRVGPSGREEVVDDTLDPVPPAATRPAAAPVPA